MGRDCAASDNDVMLWDVFCRVIDNFGDIGVCWRLAADLAARGEHVRLWVDDASALHWMAPLAIPAVAVMDWAQADGSAQPGEVVIEAFGCELPMDFVQAMAARPAPSVWINLEYLTAEPYALRSHGLQSPQLSGPGAGLNKWFFYPGLQSGSGGLLRELDLLKRQAAFNPAAWLDEKSCAPQAGERVVSLFCYDNPRLPELLAALSHEPTLLLVTAGAATLQVRKAIGDETKPGPLRIRFLPLLSQADYDHLLWASDLNFVRGEDSFVRAQWAGKPFIWQIYPQHDSAHAPKLRAFVDVFESLTQQRGLLWPVWSAWNGLSAAPWALPPARAWQAASLAWQRHLGAQTDLTSHLQSFVAERR
jgi:uncharacterized repeat protein (TIGR03837 family)